MSDHFHIGLSVVGPDKGIAQGGALIRPMVCTPAVTKGDVLTVDMATVEAVSGQFAYTTMRNNAAGDNAYGWSGVALESAAAGAIARFGFIGDFDALSDTAHAVGERMSLDAASNNLMDAPASTCKVLAFALEAFSGSNVKRCRFDGIHGFGIGMLATS